MSEYKSLTLKHIGELVVVIAAVCGLLLFMTSYFVTAKEYANDRKEYAEDRLEFQATLVLINENITEILIDRARDNNDRDKVRRFEHQLELLEKRDLIIQEKILGL